MVSAFITRDDKLRLGEMVEGHEQMLKTLCVEKVSIDKSCLGHGLLHLNRKGSAYFGKNLLNFINDFLRDDTGHFYQDIDKLTWGTVGLEYCKWLDGNHKGN